MARRAREKVRERRSLARPLGRMWRSIERKGDTESYTGWHRTRVVGDFLANFVAKNMKMQRTFAVRDGDGDVGGVGCGVAGMVGLRVIRCLRCW